MENTNILRQLGRTGIMVTPIGLGCWQFSKQNNMAGKFWPTLEDDLIDKIVSLSLQGGINWFDTAEVYGNGASEKALSKALQAAGIRPGQVRIATKWWPMFRFASNIPKTIDERIKALAPYPIDLYQVHQPWGFSNEKSEMAAMAELLDRKLIKSIGVSNFSAQKMKNAREVLDKKGIPLASNQVPYNLLNRKIETNGVMDTAKKIGISIIAYSPLAQGLVTGKFHDNPELLENTGFRKYSSRFKTQGLEKSRPVIMLVKELALKYNVTPSQIALNWLIHFHGDTVVAIPGATKEIHVKENTGAMLFRLSDEDMWRLDKESAIFK
ncbi:MAG TPA: aldo/keto reductase [Bacteroidales bacterium]|nr:aldo/keto reductase [Bacteroidales bacterium]